MTHQEVLQKLAVIPQWRLDVLGAETLVREYVFPNFRAALSAVNQIGELAETANHHPNLYLYDYKHVRVELTTHSAGGVSEKDFLLAVEIEKLLK